MGVFLDDTKGPARKATVYLQPVAALLADKPPDHNHGAAEGDATVGVQTRFEGGFSFSHVAAGSYYVIASYPGYLAPYVALSLAEGRSPYGAWQPLTAAESNCTTPMTIPSLAHRIFRRMTQALPSTSSMKASTCS